MAFIWIVIGRVGEYSDATEWPVLAFASEALAREHALSAAARVSAFLATRHVTDRYDEDLSEDEAEALDSIDPGLVYRPRTGPNAGKPFLLSRVAYSGHDVPSYTVARVRVAA